MGPLSDRALRVIVKSLGVTSDALTHKLDRVTGQLHEDTCEELDYLDELLGHLRAEQGRRRSRHTAA
jgi:hypothetical protein